MRGGGWVGVTNSPHKCAKYLCPRKTWCLSRARADIRNKKPLGIIPALSEESACAGRKFNTQKVNPHFATGSLCPSWCTQTVRNPHDKMAWPIKLKPVNRTFPIWGGVTLSHVTRLPQSPCSLNTWTHTAHGAPLPGLGACVISGKAPRSLTRIWASPMSQAALGGVGINQEIKQTKVPALMGLTF